MVISRPALFLKEITINVLNDLIMLKPDLDAFVDVCGLPDQYKWKLKKIDCCNLVSDFL